MTTEEITNYCMSLPEVKQAVTNDGKWTVFMKDSNVFLLIRRNNPIFKCISLTLTEERGEELQDEYNIVSPSLLGRKGWYDVDIDNDFPADEMSVWINESYEKVSKMIEDEEKSRLVSMTKILGLQ